MWAWCFPPPSTCEKSQALSSSTCPVSSYSSWEHSDPSLPSFLNVDQKHFFLPVLECGVPWPLPALRAWCRCLSCIGKTRRGHRKPYTDSGVPKKKRDTNCFFMVLFVWFFIFFLFYIFFSIVVLNQLLSGVEKKCFMLSFSLLPIRTKVIYFPTGTAVSVTSGTAPQGPKQLGTCCWTPPATPVQPLLSVTQWVVF